MDERRCMAGGDIRRLTMIPIPAKGLGISWRFSNEKKLGEPTGEREIIIAGVMKMKMMNTPRRDSLLCRSLYAVLTDDL